VGGETSKEQANSGNVTVYGCSNKFGSFTFRRNAASQFARFLLGHKLRATFWWRLEGGASLSGTSLRSRASFSQSGSGRFQDWRAKKEGACASLGLWCSMAVVNQ
jgi:hypothetical protein